MSDYYPIVGARFRPPAKTLIDYLPLNTPLSLELEPDNPHDSNAVRVVLATASIPQHIHADLAEALPGSGFTLDEVLAEPSHHLGYVPARFAAILAPAMANAGLGSDRAPATFTFDRKGGPAAIPADATLWRSALMGEDE